ncbi:peptide-methionine (S)-S-oxide reductase MsrA [Aquisalinus flavus]|nr:peptide-methionine (S)-S-oxide reductase MsrA [Aquisalinus flavus]UNE49166.1 peptide-methionine (S)-S-oxide reductase MsrA [Aquisalinus flavus]
MQTDMDANDMAAGDPLEDYAIFAGGCFWCVEADFEKMEGVDAVVSGYSGGTSDDPTYKTYEKDGHREVAKIYYDPSVITYRTLADRFFRTVDPTDDGGQFCDRGFGYTTAIYVKDDEQRAAAEAAKMEAEDVLDREIVTPILDAREFHAAEEYHQDYYKKSSVRYNLYRRGCGRDARLRSLWGDEAWIK